METKSNVIKVLFPVAVDGKREYFFGSLAAIYDMFTPYQIGCNLATLWKAGVEPGKPKKTKKCIVSKYEVHRKEQRNKKGFP